MPPSRLEMLRTFVAQKPNDPFPRYALAHELKNAGDLAGAWEVFAALMTDHADYTATYLHAGNTLVALDRREEAGQVYRRGIEVCRVRGDSHARGELEGALAALSA